MRDIHIACLKRGYKQYFQQQYNRHISMKFIADFHIHSKYSRATSKNLDFENLYIAAQLKGITVIGTGDFTHPGWFAEIREKLIPAEDGLFRLKEDIALQCDRQVPPSCHAPVRFMLVTEISSIYKKKKKTRKNHNLVFFPDLQCVERFNSKLDAIGNITSDGRPILGLDARHLLEMVLETSDHGFLVPAHIWTPWFSVLGSKSGFDSLEECFEDLTDRIFAVETGLSSDPAMNRRVSQLDGLTLISNSDAHSPANLGREANFFDTRLSYRDIQQSMSSGDPDTFLGTLEFYPEEGKYHLDGHRKCGVRLHPEETILHAGKCPQCGGDLTKGVLYRVEELADRKPDGLPPHRHDYTCIVPLAQILSEIFQTGVQSKKVQRYYRKALDSLGPELEIVHQLSLSKLDSSGIPLLREAVGRMRRQQMTILPGYDGEYGSVRLFQEGEQERLLGQQSLFRSVPNQMKDVGEKSSYGGKLSGSRPFGVKQSANGEKAVSGRAGRKDLNSEQSKAVEHDGTPLLIVAGPGTGKTMTLTHRIAYLIREREVLPENILAVTFTNKASREMAERLKNMLDTDSGLPTVATFHALCFDILKQLKNKTQYAIVDEADRFYMAAEAVQVAEVSGDAAALSTEKCLEMIIAAKQMILDPEDDLEAFCEPYGFPWKLFRNIYRSYQNLLSVQGLYDYEDLILRVVKLLEKGKNICRMYQDRFRWLFIDEYQDLNHGQYRIVKALASRSQNICAIGDPDQSIYGFRGSNVEYFNRFIQDYPDTAVVHLKRNYRSTETILEASHHVIRDLHINITGSRTYSEIEGQKRIAVLNPDNDKAEAVLIGKMIEDMVGGIGFHSHYFDKVKTAGTVERSFSDFAILYRTNSQGGVFADAFDKAGIPYQMVSKENIFRRKGIHELLSLYKIIAGTGSYADLERVVSYIGEGIGKKTFGVLKKWCFKHHFSTREAIINTKRFPIDGMSSALQLKLDAFFEAVADMERSTNGMTVSDKLNYLRTRNPKIDAEIAKDKRTESVFEKLIQMAGNQGGVDLDFLEKISLSVDTDLFQHEGEKVALLTMHASKGLEFPVVFITGCENDLMPYRRSSKDNPDVSEEKRLLYVAMTRAKDLLFLSHAGKRRLYGRETVMSISPFIEEIEEDLRRHVAPTAKKKVEKKQKQVQLSLF